MKILGSIALALVVVFLFYTCAEYGNSEEYSNKTNDYKNYTYANQQSQNYQSDYNEETESVNYVMSDNRVNTWVDSININRAQTIIEIKNNGDTNLYLSSGSYDLESYTTGDLVAAVGYAEVYPQVLAPGEKGYMYGVHSLDSPTDDKLIAVPHFDIEKAKVELVRFPVSEVSIKEDSYGRIKVIGRVKNTSNEKQGYINIVAFLYDNEGTCIGLLDTITLTDINAGEQTGFELSETFLPDDVNLESIADYVVYAYPTQYQF